MSWETFTVGQIRFKEDAPVKKIDQALAEFREALQCDVEWNPEWKMWEFQDVNWHSHVSGERVKEVYERHRDILDYFAFSLFYLDEPNEEIVYDQGTEVVSVW